MALTPRYKRRIFWSTLCTFCALFLCIIIIPPFITLNKFKPAIEKSIHEQMQVPAKLNGDIHFSLIGGATIVAHDVDVPTAHIGSVMLSLPFSNLFDIQNANLDKAVVIYNAEITVDKLTPAAFNHNIEIYNSKINFMGKQYQIIRANFSDGEFHGTIRTSKHKYDIEFIGNTFHIKNKNNALEITGQVFSDGLIRGHISLTSPDIDEWINLDILQTDTPIHLSTNFEWDGRDNYDFTNIKSDIFSGNIKISPDGTKDIQLVSDDITLDLSFLLSSGNLFHKTNLNLDFYGDLTLGTHKFNHLRIHATSNDGILQIATVIADDIVISGGKITKNGAQDIMLTIPINDTTAMCLFSGTPNKWQCSTFSYGDITGSINVSDNTYDIFIQSDKPMPSNQNLLKLASRFGSHGTIHFKFSDIGGKYTITPDGIIPSYNFARNKTLSWLNIDIPFLPEFMYTTPGNFSWESGMLTFVPHNQEWQLSAYDNYFYLSGTSFKSWLPDIDLRFLTDSSYIISGFYNNKSISNLNIKISNHSFTGSASGNNITLHTSALTLDAFTNPTFFDNFEEQEFLSNAPILTLFNLPVNLAISAEKLIYNNNEYKNFVYTLKSGVQTFSITDSDRGNILLTIEQDKTSYDIFAQLNRFVINGPLLTKNMPLNIRDTMLTGQIALTTSGQIAHDIYYNMSGTIDLVLDGGYLIGMSFDKFYASAENITSLNAEYALADALTGGETVLKTLHIVGNYQNGDFITTSPLELSMRHTSAIGGLAITDGMMTAEFDLTMRGTAPTPATIALSVLPDGKRQYSLSEIMKDIDPGFMRAFIKTHDKF